MAMELKYGQQYISTPNSNHSSLEDEEIRSIVTEEGIKLVDKVMCNMSVAKNFTENTEAINSIDFSQTGKLMISASDDDQIIVYDCEQGIISRPLKSKKYGVCHIRFTHAPNTVLHASTKVDDTIRYLSLYDNKYLRYFQGHTKRVTGISMSPIEDRFLSTSLDKTLRIWDLNSPNCQGMMKMEENAVASIDPEGLVFAVLINKQSIKLYDIRSFDKGPFSTFNLPLESGREEWGSLKFSPNGKQILLTKVGSSIIYIMDAFEGRPLYSLQGQNVLDKNLSLEASFTPDSKYIVSGSEDGKVHVWNAQTGRKLCILNGSHPRPIQCIQFNPKFMMMASACTDMAFWLPRLPDSG